MLITSECFGQKSQDWSFYCRFGATCQVEWYHLGYICNPHSLMEGTETLCRDDIGDSLGSPNHLWLQGKTPINIGLWIVDFPICRSLRVMSWQHRVCGKPQPEPRHNLVACKCCFYILIPKYVCVVVTSHWPPHINWVTVPPAVTNSHITLQTKTGCPLKLSRVEWGQQGVLKLQSVWVLMPQYSDGDTIL